MRLAALAVPAGVEAGMHLCYQCAMNDPRLPRRVVAGVIAALAITSCSLLDPEKDAVPTKMIDKSAQTDPAPVRKRTHGLSEDAGILWFSGTLGSGRPAPRRTGSMPG